MNELNRFVFVQKSGITVPSSTVGNQAFNRNASDYIQEGQIAVADPAGRIYNAGTYNASTNPFGLTSMPTDLIPSKVKLLHRKGNVLYSTSEFETANKDIIFNAKAYRPALEQVTYVGYNETDGTLVTSLDPNILYKMSIVRQDNENYVAVDRPESAFFGSPDTFGSAATENTDQLDLAIGLAEHTFFTFIKGFTGYKPWQIPIKVEVVTSNAGTGAVTANVFNNSSIITVSDATGLVAGQSVIIAGKVYRIKSISGLNVTLTIEYQGATATGVAFKTATWAKADKFGIKITGKTLEFDKLLWPYRKVFFEVATNAVMASTPIRHYGTCDVAFETKGYTTTTTNVVAANTLITNSKAFTGVGTTPQVATAEYDNIGAFSRETSHQNNPIREARLKYITDLNGTSCTYSVLVVNWKRLFTNNPVSQFVDNGSVTIAIPVTYNTSTAGITETVATAANYGFVKVLEKLFNVTFASALTTY